MLKSLFRRKLPTFTKETYEKLMLQRLRSTRDLDEYFAQLPVYLLSRCPFCNRPLRYRFDPFGLRGYWWDNGVDTISPESACRHFFLLQGALNLNGHLPDETNGYGIDREVGPDVPFVIPRLMKLKNMIAVIHQVTVRERYTGYPIGYFADPRPPYREGHPGWTCNTYGVNGLKKSGWGMRNDVYDYDLGPYISAKRVRWLDPADSEHAVRQGQPAECPYYNLPGVRQRQKVVRGGVFLYGNPDGVTPPDPFHLRDEGEGAS